MRLAAAALLFAFCPLAHAQDASLFNVTLGRPIDSYPSCYSPEGEGKICVHPSKFDVRGNDYAVYIELRPGPAPSFLRTNLTASVEDGRIKSLAADTRGILQQDAALSYLIDRYGKPAKIDKRVLQNMVGAKFVVVEASWQVKGTKAMLLFTGATENLQEGYIVLSAK